MVSTQELWKWWVIPARAAQVRLRIQTRHLAFTTRHSSLLSTNTDTWFRPMNGKTMHVYVRQILHFFCNGTVNKMYYILKITVLYGVMSCRFVGKYKRLGRTCWHVPPKRWYISTRCCIIRYSSQLRMNARVLKYVGDNRKLKLNINLENCVFLSFVLYNHITMQGENNIKKT